MFYRLAGIKHTSYAHEARLWPLALDRRVVVLFAAFALAAPALVSSLFLSSYMLPWLIWSTAALGLNLLMGTAGQIHLGFAAVMGIGAYASAHAARAGLPFELALLIAGLASAIAGMVFGAAALRLRGLYLAISTLAMQYICDFVISHVPAISGGSQAVLATPPVRILSFDVGQGAGAYYVALAICVVVTVFMLNVRRTAFGRALIAIREKDFAAEILGISAFHYKLLAFWTSSFIGGVAGAVLVFCYYRTVSPEQFHLETSIQLVAMVIVGGLGSVLGCFFGAALIMLAPIFLDAFVARLTDSAGFAVSTDFRAHLPLVLYGMLIVGFLIAEPLGLAKLYDNTRNYFLVWPFRYSRK